jgi:glycerol-3-phosphate dehydrogenase
VLDHGKSDGLPGLLSVLSVKYTTARAVAEAVVDAAGSYLGRRLPPSRTAVEPLAQAAPLRGALADRARHVVREEAALHLDDAVLRRLDLGTGRRPPAAEVDEVAAVMAEELGWDAGRQVAEGGRLAAGLREVEAR